MTGSCNCFIIKGSTLRSKLSNLRIILQGDVCDMVSPRDIKAVQLPSSTTGMRARRFTQEERIIGELNREGKEKLNGGHVGLEKGQKKVK